MASCYTPLEVQHDGAYYKVPCGKCQVCIKRRISGWSFRLIQEERRSVSAFFVTMTYDPENLPRTKSGYRTLDKTHVQKFFKRLRKQCPGRKIKYYACGEYGTETMRPHYHAIIFNCKIEEIDRAWALDDKPIGYCYYGTVTGASIGYVLKYMCKDKKIPLHQNDDRVPEFSLMSKRLGANYLTDKAIRWHKDELEDRMYILIEGGKKIAMPRYFKDKIYDEIERHKIAQAALIKQYDLQLRYERQMFKIHGENWLQKEREAHIHSFQKLYKDGKKDRGIL